jgi:cathepsin B
MRVLLTLILLGIALCHVHNHDHEAFITAEYIEDLKTKVSFEVADYESNRFKDYTLAQLKAMMGVKTHPDFVPVQMDYTESDSAPASFDARTAWPACVHQIRDQAHCGSCWAFAASEVLSDRFCIASGGRTNVILSPQDLVSCDASDYGCQGGYLDHSWSYLVNTGIVADDCLPYSSGGGAVAACPSSGGFRCTGRGSNKKYKASSYTKFTSIEQVKGELVANGPVETAFDVYDDFMSYSGGIYVKRSSNFIGGHAVKIVGYGNSNGTNYWIVANSWGSAWGERGFFRFAFGQCNFDSQVITGRANLKALKTDNLHK